MTRSLLISLSLSLALTAIATFYFIVDRGNNAQLEERDVSPAFESTSEPLYEPTDPPVSVKLFFPATNNDVLLRTRNMTIFASADLENRARQIIDHLRQGADDADIYGRLPEGTELNEAFVADNGLLYLDFNSALSDNHPGGILPELATLYSIVNSIAYNIDEIERVKILIGGNERETLAGHCLLLLPLRTDVSLSDIAMGTEPPVASQSDGINAN